MVLVRRRAWIQGVSLTLALLVALPPNFAIAASTSSSKTSPSPEVQDWQNAIDTLADARRIEMEKALHVPMADSGIVGHGVKVIKQAGAPICEEDTSSDSGTKCYPQTKYGFSDLRVYNPHLPIEQQPLTYGEQQAYGFLRSAQKTLVLVNLDTRAELAERASTKLGISFQDPEEVKRGQKAASKGAFYVNEHLLPTTTYELLLKNYSTENHPSIWSSVDRLAQIAALSAPTTNLHELQEEIDVALELSQADRGINALRPKREMNYNVEHGAPGILIYVDSTKEFTEEQKMQDGFADIVDEEKYKLFPESRHLFFEVPLDDVLPTGTARDLARRIQSWSDRDSQAVMKGSVTLYAAMAGVILDAQNVRPKDLDTVDTAAMDWDSLTPETIAKVQKILAFGINAYLEEQRLAIEKILNAPDEPRAFNEEFFGYAPLFFAKTGLRAEMDRNFIIPRDHRDGIETLLTTEYASWQGKREKERRDSNRNQLIFGGVTLVAGLLYAAVSGAAWVARSAWAARIFGSASWFQRIAGAYIRLRRTEKWVGVGLTIAATVEACVLVYSLLPDYTASRDLRHLVDATFFAPQASDPERSFARNLTMADVQQYRAMDREAVSRLTWGWVILGLSSLPAAGWMGGKVFKLVRQRWVNPSILVDENVMARLLNELKVVEQTGTKVEAQIGTQFLKDRADDVVALRSEIEKLCPTCVVGVPKLASAARVERMIEMQDVARSERAQKMIEYLSDLMATNQTWRSRLKAEIGRLTRKGISPLSPEYQRVEDLKEVLHHVDAFYENFQRALRALPHTDKDSRAVRTVERLLRKSRTVDPAASGVDAIAASGMKGIRATATEQATFPLGMVNGTPIETALATNIDKVQPGLWDKLIGPLRWADEKAVGATNRFMRNRGWDVKFAKGTLTRFAWKTGVNASAQTAFERYVISPDEEKWNREGKKVLAINISIGMITSLVGTGLNMSTLTFFERPFARAIVGTGAALAITSVANYKTFSDAGSETPAEDLLKKNCMQALGNRLAFALAWGGTLDGVKRWIEASVTAVENTMGNSKSGLLTKTVIVGADAVGFGIAFRGLSEWLGADGICEGDDGSIAMKLARLTPEQTADWARRVEADELSMAGSDLKPTMADALAMGQFLALRQSPVGFGDVDFSALQDSVSDSGLQSESR